MARLIVGDGEDAFYAKTSGGVWTSKPLVLWPQKSGGTRYTDVLYPDNSPSGNGSVNGTAYTGGVLLTGSDGSYGAQLPDGVDVPGAWVELDGHPVRVFLRARQADGSEPLSAQSAATAAVAAVRPTDGAVAVSAAQAVAAGGAVFATQAALTSLSMQVSSGLDGGTPDSSSTAGGFNFDGGTP